MLSGPVDPALKPSNGSFSKLTAGAAAPGSTAAEFNLRTLGVCALCCRLT